MTLSPLSPAERGLFYKYGLILQNLLHFLWRYVIIVLYEPMECLSGGFILSERLMASLWV